MPQFTFGQVEALLAQANDIASDKRQAFSARLKHLQKQGLRGETSQPGRGKAATHSFDEVMQLALAVELLKAGLPPQRAAKLVSHNWSAVRFTAYLSTLSSEEAGELACEGPAAPVPTDWLWLIRADALAELTVAGESEYDLYEAIEAVDSEGLAALLDTHSRGGDPQGRRTLLVHGTALTRAVLHQAAFRFGFAKIEEMRGDLEAELQRQRAIIEEVKDSIGQNGPALTDEEHARFRAAHNLRPPEKPGSRIQGQAEAILRRLDPQALSVLIDLYGQTRNGGGANVTIDETSRGGLQRLCEFGLIDIATHGLANPNDQVPSMEVTNLGFIVMKLANEKEASANVDPEA
ncbi:hypothetical protein NCF86_00305 [Pelagerythrobacter marinus]|nr:hypothetical protein NCF86_00305 [Pelagerythrobacter marinus]